MMYKKKNQNEVSSESQISSLFLRIADIPEIKIFSTKLLERVKNLGTQQATSETGDHEMLSFYLDEVVNGVDIETQYPSFYQQLLKNSTLLEVFLDGLQLMDQENLHPAPLEVQVDLSILSQLEESENLIDDENDKWKISWNRSIEQLQMVFAPMTLALRSPHLLQEEWFTLLREDCEVGSLNISVMLDAGLSEKKADTLEMVIYLGSQKQELKPHFTISAKLDWGQYSETLIFNEQWDEEFPPISLNLILDSNGETINQDLSLELSFNQI